MAAAEIFRHTFPAEKNNLRQFPHCPSILFNFDFSRPFTLSWKKGKLGRVDVGAGSLNTVWAVHSDDIEGACAGNAAEKCMLKSSSPNKTCKFGAPAYVCTVSVKCRYMVSLSNRCLCKLCFCVKFTISQKKGGNSQGWASVFFKECNVLAFIYILYKRTFCSWHSFPFFIRQCSVLCNPLCYL